MKKIQALCVAVALLMAACTPSANQRLTVTGTVRDALGYPLPGAAVIVDGSANGAVTDPDGARGNNISAFVVEKSDEGFTFGEKERKLGIKGSPTRELFFENCRILQQKASTYKRRRNMSKHPSLKGASTIRQSRNVLKRFERINQLKEEGRWKEGQKVISALPKTKPEE